MPSSATNYAPEPPPEITGDETAVTWWSMFQAMHFPQAFRDELTRGFLSAYRGITAMLAAQKGGPPLPDQEASNARANYRLQSSLPATATSTDVSTVRPVSPDMVTPIDMEYTERAVLELAYRIGHELHRDRAHLLAEDLSFHAEPEWSRTEFDRALRLIRMDAALGKEVTFDRTITPRIFALARERWAVRSGRVFQYDEACEACRERKGFTFSELFDPARDAEGNTVFVLRAEGALRLDKAASRDDQ